MRLSMKEVCARVKRKPMTRAKRQPDQLKLFFFSPLQSKWLELFFLVPAKTNLRFFETGTIEIQSQPGMGNISKQRQLNEKIEYGVIQDLSFYETRWFLKISFKHLLLNEI
jgi:hypothetical protein